MKSDYRIWDGIFFCILYFFIYNICCFNCFSNCFTFLKEKIKLFYLFNHKYIIIPSLNINKLNFGNLK